MFDSLIPSAAQRTPVAESIRKLGFRRWHERQLIEAHAGLVTAFLCLIVVLVCNDQLNWRDAGFKPLINLALIVGGIALCYKTVTLYFEVMFRAEHFAAQAVCSVCKTYGRIEVLASSAQASQDIAADPGSSDWFKVRCRKCSHGWTMTAMEPDAPGKKSL
ncbi:MAG: hypothetical protein ABI831_16750 [Betaproteobacteria bacterium]